MSNPVFPNPPVAVESLIQPMTPAIVLQTIVNTLVSMGVRADLWKKQGTAISCMTALANIVSAGINDRIAATKAAWLPTAVGAWLTWLALYMYGVFRTEASFATGPLTLTNGGGGTYSFAPFTATFQNPTTKATYQNTTAIALGPGPGTMQTITIQATALGSQGNSAPGTVTALITTMLGVTCSNLAPVLGIDEQDDPNLQLECWNSIAANSAYGPRQSFGYAVQTAVNSVTGSPVNINRFLPPPASHTGMVTLTIASPSGAADPNDVIGVANQIEAIARPPNVQVAVQSATPVSYVGQFAGTLTVYVANSPGLAASSVATAIENALDDFFENYPVGGRVGPLGFQGVFAAAVDAACASAWPPKPTDPTVPWRSSVFDVIGTIDMALTSGQVATNGIITVAVVLV